METVEIRRDRTTRGCSHDLYLLVLYYHCPTDINIEIKEVIFNFSLCELRECKLRSAVTWKEVFKPKRHKSKPGFVCNQIS